MIDTSRHPDLERVARRRAGAKMGWIIHAIAFASVNVLLAALTASQERQWAVYPALGWGLGLAVHGVVVFFATGGAGLHERLVARERARLASQRRD